MLLQTAWASKINPVLSSPIATPVLLKNQVITTGAVNVINHGLQRPLIGWIPIRVRAQATLWDTQDVNQSPNLSLFLNSDANVTIDLLVF